MVESQHAVLDGKLYFGPSNSSTNLVRLTTDGGFSRTQRLTLAR